MYKIMTKPDCPFCVAAIEEIEGRAGEYYTVPHNTEEAIQSFKAAGYRTFPQIFLDGEHIGGYDDLVESLNTEDDF